MADMAALNCLKAKRSGKFFTLEHPKNSIARDLESWKNLESEEGVWATEYHSCMFRGSERRKAQVLIHNIPLLNSRLNLICNSSRVCTRTGKPHLSWKPRVEKGRVTSFATSLEREYPEGFCEAYAHAIGGYSMPRPHIRRGLLRAKRASFVRCGKSLGRSSPSPSRHSEASRA